MSVTQEVVFYCWRCGQKLAVPDSIQGKSLGCPACECLLTVPTAAEVMKRACPRPVVDPLVATENDITFHCEHCDWEIIVDKRAAGRIVPCPGCSELIVVPEPPTEPAPAPQPRVSDTQVIADAP
jgi:DNA-directed RNA polymerase subunit RPC12/RpoP